jgi:hypothetical protein
VSPFAGATELLSKLEVSFGEAYICIECIKQSNKKQVFDEWFLFVISLGISKKEVRGNMCA